MLRNYLKIAWRNFLRNKVYSFINIGGLAIGMAVCLLISLYVFDETGYDHYHSKADRIYRVNFEAKFGGADKEYATVPDAMGATLKNDYPFIETFSRLRGNDVVVEKGSQTFREYMALFADNSVFEVFDLPFIHGDPKTALVQPYTVVLDENTAIKYFGKTDVIGQSMVIHEDAYKVTGVMENIPENSHLKGRNMLLSLEAWKDSKSNNWLSSNYITYLVFKKGTKPEQLQSQFGKVIGKYMLPQFTGVLGVKSIAEFEKAGNRMAFSLTALKDIHLYSNKTDELSPNGNIQYVYIFSAVALFILLIACINFMNLSTARSANRAKEVGIRKVMGSVRSHLMGQFLAESVSMSLIAFVLGLGIAYLVLPYFNDLAAKQMSLSFAHTPVLLPVLVIFSIIIGLLAGIYPALFLSAFKPVSVLKGKLTATGKGSFLRSGLVVFQFFASAFLIICTIVIYKQLNYIQTKNIGFNKEQVLLINDTDQLGQGLESFKNELLQLPEIKSAAISGFLPTPSYRNNNAFWPEGESDFKKSIAMQFWEVSHDYTKTFDMKIRKGRDFNRTMSTDSSAMIINEAAAKLSGFKDPIGKKLYLYTSLEPKKIEYFTVIGVVKDFHFESLRKNVGAMALRLSKVPYGMIALRTQTQNIKATIAKIDTKWQSRAEGAKLNYQFLDEAFDNMYRSEQRIGKIFISFAIFAILIACLGLFGLVTFTAEQRTKEIGIRKVLGASVGQMVTLLSKDFLKLVLIAFVIAVPIAWYAMHQWLQGFAYKVDVSWWIFALAGILALVIALLTVSFQAIKAALANPVNSLRSE